MYQAITKKMLQYELNFTIKHVTISIYYSLYCSPVLKGTPITGFVRSGKSGRNVSKILAVQEKSEKPERVREIYSEKQKFQRKYEKSFQHILRRVIISSTRFLTRYRFISNLVPNSLKFQKVLELQGKG